MGGGIGTKPGRCKSARVQVGVSAGCNAVIGDDMVVVVAAVVGAVAFVVVA